jgi:hypothetical protein
MNEGNQINSQVNGIWPGNYKTRMHFLHSSKLHRCMPFCTLHKLQAPEVKVPFSAKLGLDIVPNWELIWLSHIYLNGRRLLRSSLLQPASIAYLANEESKFQFSVIENYPRSFVQKSLPFVATVLSVYKFFAFNKLKTRTISCFKPSKLRYTYQ